jgi:SAM-dependent methyltransferase
MPPDSIRAAYKEEGVAGFYSRAGADYRNPNEAGVKEALKLALKWKPDFSSVLDLGCGSGEATLALKAFGVASAAITGCDPYTGAAFLARTGRKAESWSFVDIASGCLEDRRFSLVIASFSLHLCPESLLPGLCYALSQASRQLLVLTPHKRPEIRWGWKHIAEDYARIERVRVRFYSL